MFVVRAALKTYRKKQETKWKNNWFSGPFIHIYTKATHTLITKTGSVKCANTQAQCCHPLALTLLSLWSSIEARNVQEQHLYMCVNAGAAEWIRSWPCGGLRFQCRNGQFVGKDLLNVNLRICWHFNGKWTMAVKIRNCPRPLLLIQEHFHTSFN